MINEKWKMKNEKWKMKNETILKYSLEESRSVASELFFYSYLSFWCFSTVTNFSLGVKSKNKSAKMQLTSNVYQIQLFKIKINYLFI
jgi:hypothetical protein